MAMTPKERYLEAAYLYYLHPEHGIVLMSDSEWDALGRELFAAGEIDHAGSLFHMKEMDYPESVRTKYGNDA
jgi:hypothetical protein